MPTCRPKYTDVPTPADYKHFQPPVRGLLGELYKAGLQVITAISERCRPDIEAVLHGDVEPLVEVLQLTLSRTLTLTQTLTRTRTRTRTRTSTLTLTLTLTVAAYRPRSRRARQR